MESERNTQQNTEQSEQEQSYTVSEPEDPPVDPPKDDTSSEETSEDKTDKDTESEDSETEGECPKYPECPPNQPKEKGSPLFIPITTEISPIIKVLVNKPKYCVQNKADTEPCFFRENKEE